MAESLAAISLVSAIVQFVDVSGKVVERLNEFQSKSGTVPQTFLDLRIQLPLLRQTLNITKLHAETNTIDDDTRSAVLAVVEGCQTQLKLLDTILIQTLPKTGDSRFRRGMKAFSSVTQDKTVRQIVDRIQEYKVSLIHYQTALPREIPIPNPLSTNSHPRTENCSSTTTSATFVAADCEPVKSEADGFSLVHVHVDGGGLFADKSSYFPPAMTLHEMYSKMFGNIFAPHRQSPWGFVRAGGKDLGLFRCNGKPIPFLSPKQCVVVTDGPSDYSRLLISKDEAFDAFFGKLSPRSAFKICVSNYSADDRYDSVRIKGDLEISFHRTVRLPNDGSIYDLPGDLGIFPLHAIQEFREKVPQDMREKGGLVIPMWQREAMWLRFASHYSSYAIRPFVGGINAISGEPVRPNMSTILKRLNKIEKKQDYVVVRRNEPSQRWLDGVAVAPGVVRQFVAVPLGHGNSVESQATYNDSVGGLQLEIIPQYPAANYYFYKKEGCYTIYEDLWGEYLYRDTRPLATPVSIGLAIGSPLYMRRPCAPGDGHRRRTILDELHHSGNIKDRTLKFEVKERRTLTVSVTLYDKERFFKLKSDHLISRVVEIFWELEGKKPEDLSGFFTSWGGTRLEKWDTADTLRMEDMENIEIHQEQVGGGSTTPDNWVHRRYETPQMGYGAGGKILQSIVADTEDPQAWNTDAAVLLNIQVLNSEAFESIAGCPPPPTPITLTTLREAGIPVFSKYKEARSPIHGDFNKLLAIDDDNEDFEKTKEGTQISETRPLVTCDACRCVLRNGYRCTTCAFESCFSCRAGHSCSRTSKEPVSNQSRQRNDVTFQLIKSDDGREPFQSVVELRLKKERGT